MVRTTAASAVAEVAEAVVVEVAEAVVVEAVVEFVVWAEVWALVTFRDWRFLPRGGSRRLRLTLRWPMFSLRRGTRILR
jgi:hypothetical protein